MSKKLVFRNQEFIADFITKTEKSIIFYNSSNEEINRLQPINPSETYTVYNADGTVGTFDIANFNTNIISTGTDIFRLVYALMKEIDTLTDEVSTLTTEVNTLKGSAS